MLQFPVYYENIMNAIILRNLVFLFFIFRADFALAQLYAGFSSDRTVGCGMIGINLSDQSTGNPNSWQWNFGDGGTSILQNPSHNYLTPGTYTISLTVSNGVDSDTETKNSYINVFTLPVADFTQSDSSGCAPLSIKFSDASFSATSTIISWLWNFGDGHTSTLKNPVHIYSVPGTYTVTLYASDQKCSGTKIKSGLIKVLDSLSSVFTLNSNYSCIVPFDASFNNTSTVGADFSYLWNFGDGSPSSSDINPMPHTYTSFGTYSISLIVTNPAGCADTAIQLLSLAPFSSAFSADDSLGCASDSFTFSSINSTPTSFQWTFPGGLPVSSSSSNPTVIYNSPGSYDVTLVASNSQGCSEIFTVEDYIRVFPQPGVSFTANDSASCSTPFSVNFEAKAPGASSLVWSFAGGLPLNSTDENPTVTYSTNGKYSVSLSVIDTNGCMSTSFVNDFIQIALPLAAFAASPVNGCFPLIVNFTDTSSSNPSVTQWEWNFGDPASEANTSFLQNPMHIYNDTGIYDIQLIITNSDGCTDTIFKNDRIKAGMKGTADFSPKNISGCHPLTVEFTNLSSAFCNSWKWTFSNGQTTYSSSAFNPTKTFMDTGFFDVRLIASHNGCSDTVIVNDAVFVKPAKPIIDIDDRVLCEDEVPYEFTLENKSIAAEKWTWKFGDGSPDVMGSGLQSQPQSHTYQSPGIYSIWLVVENFTTGCIDSLSASVGISDINVDFVTDTIAGCQPLEISFKDSSLTNSSLMSLSWKFGDGANTPDGMGSVGIPVTVTNTTGTFSKPKHRYTDHGSYDVSLIIVDSLLCSDTLLVHNLIEIKPLPIAKFSSDTTSGCVPLAINFTDNSFSTTPVQSWFWDFGNGNTDSLRDPVDTFSQRGLYSVKLIVTDSFNCKDDIVIINYINASLPHPDFIVETDSICNNEYSVLTNTSTPDSDLTFIWDFGDNSSPDTSKNPVHTFAVNSGSSTILNVSLMAKDYNGCISTIKKPIFISIPEAGINFVGQNGSCPPFDALFLDSSSGEIESWYWNFGDGSPEVSNMDNKVGHTYENPGYFDLSVVVIDILGCKDTLKKDSMIYVSGPGGDFAFSVDTMRCYSEVNFVANAHGASSLSWDFRDGLTGIGNNIMHRYKTPGIYVPVLILKDSNNCEVVVTGDSLVISTSTISALVEPNKNNIFPENNIIFKGSSTSSVPVVLWEWDFGDKDVLISPSVYAPLHQYDAPGNYPVVLKITDADSCSAIFDTLITIIQGIVIPTVFTPDGDGINDNFTVRQNGFKEHYIVIFNRYGEMIFENRAPEINWEGKNFSGTEVAPGTYFYVLQSTDPEGEVYENKSHLTLIR